ncbi:hypothetical protein C1Y63_04790 [Corynebacterium sp. 13CS0277]|uniref:hypothetical protein n=1 Tax=Corynebacterium sp. 13CS0277 TaxID=2071994 RepID=UPI000D03F33A|nr:hypothetical protein [Corynebacterium sp. 13CS0277]PRQ11728.1 hypothetical protein C1Y63_04790 [Corynebacterium sp. 13CS0277]
MGKRKKNVPKDHERAERAKRALQMRLAGATYAEIGQVLGISQGTAWKDIAREIRAIPATEATELRQLELARLDRLQRAVWEDAVGGNLRAVDRVVRIIERRARLLGLDSIQVEASVDVREAIRDAVATFTPELDDTPTLPDPMPDPLE